MITIKNNRISKYKFTIIMILLYSVLFIKSLHRIDVPQFVLLFLVVTIPFFLNRGEVFAYAVSFSMLGTGIQVAYVCLSCILSLLIRCKCRLSRKQVFIPMIFLFYELVHVVLFIKFDSIIETSRYFCVFFLIIYIVTSPINNFERKLMIDSCICCSTASVLLVLVETLVYFKWSFLPLVNGTTRLGFSQQIGNRLFFSADPNLLGQGCTLVISLCLLLIFSGNKKLVYKICLVICSVAGALTLSKTFLISLALIFVLFVFGNWTKHNYLKTITSRFLLLLVVGVMAYIIYRVFPNYIDSLLMRTDTQNITNGRVNNASIYLSGLSNNPLFLFFGLGMQNTGFKIGFTGSPHSSIIECLVCWGIVGTIFVFAFLIYSAKIQVNKGTRFQNFIPLIVFSFVTQTTQLFRVRDHVLCLIVVIITCGLQLDQININESRAY